MSHHSSSTRTPTAFHHARAASRSGGSRSVVSSPRSVVSSPRTSSISSRSSAVSSWIDEVSSRSSSPSPSEWVIPGAQPFVATHPARLPSHNPSQSVPPPVFPRHLGSGHYPPSRATSHASPPPSDLGSVSSRRSKSSARTRSSTRHRAERDAYSSSPLRDLDTVPCQICLQPATVCTCVGGSEARLEMRKAARAALSGTSTAGSDSGRTHRSRELHVAHEAGGSVYAQSFWYATGYARSAVSAYSFSGQFAVTRGYAAGYYGSPMTMPMLQTAGWVDGEQGVSGSIWGVPGC